MVGSYRRSSYFQERLYLGGQNNIRMEHRLRILITKGTNVGNEKE